MEGKEWRVWKRGAPHHWDPSSCASQYSFHRLNSSNCVRFFSKSYRTITQARSIQTPLVLSLSTMPLPPLSLYQGHLQNCTCYHYCYHQVDCISKCHCHQYHYMHCHITMSSMSPSLDSLLSLPLYLMSQMSQSLKQMFHPPA